MGVARIRIGSMSYALDNEGGAVTLAKLGGDKETYRLRAGSDGRVECTCPSFAWTHKDRSTMCKHGMALVAAGHFPKPAAGPDQR